MQKVDIYVKAGSFSVGTITDESGAERRCAPELLVGGKYEIALHVFGADASTFADVAAWRIALDNDFNVHSAPLAIATSATVAEWGTKGMTITFALDHLDTAELLEWIGVNRSKGHVTLEVVGSDENQVDQFVLQLDGFGIRNRLTGTDTPTPAVGGAAWIPIDEGGWGRIRLRRVGGALLAYFLEVEDA